LKNNKNRTGGNVLGK